jgi:ligand-binding sensor domain-containing protein
VESFLDGSQARIEQVHTLAGRREGGLWLGTRRGLYHFQPGQNPLLNHNPNWPRSPIISLVAEPTAGQVWVITTKEIGQVIADQWQSVGCTLDEKFTSIAITPEGRIWVGGMWLMAKQCSLFQRK